MQGYAFQMEIIVRARKLGFVIAEVRALETPTIHTHSGAQAHRRASNVVLIFCPLRHWSWKGDVRSHMTAPVWRLLHTGSRTL